MRNRYDDALAIQSAVNLSGVARALVRHIDTCLHDENMDTTTISNDPAIRLIVYQMAYLCKVADGWDGQDYSKCVDECEAKSPERQAKVERFENVIKVLQERFPNDRIHLGTINRATFEIGFYHELKDPNKGIEGVVKLEYGARIELHAMSRPDPKAILQTMGLSFFGEARQEVRDYIDEMREAIAEVTEYCGVICTDDPGLF